MECSLTNYPHHGRSQQITSVILDSKLHLFGQAISIHWQIAIVMIIVITPHEQSNAIETKMHQFRLGFSYCNVHLSLCTFMIYDKVDVLCDSLEAMIDCLLQSGSASQFLSPSLTLTFERDGNHLICYNLSIVKQGEHHAELLTDYSFQPTFHWQD